MIIVGKDGRRRSVVTDEEKLVQAETAMSELTPAEQEFLMQMLAADEAGEDNCVELMLDHMYKHEPVTMEQFIDDPYYLGASCETLFPELRKDIIDLFDGNFWESIWTGSIGVGKTFSTSIIICRVLYELSCLSSPAKSFGLSPGSEMLIPLVSKNLVLARKVMKSAVDDKLKLSPYFLEKFPPQFKSEETIFPNNIHVIIGSYASERVLGTNVISAAMDEVNFPPLSRKQHISSSYGARKSVAHFDIVEKVYSSMVRRIKSRLQRAGGDLPGVLVLASSAATVGSFIERRIKEKENDSKVFVRDHSQWTVKPESWFCGERFKVLCSHSSAMSRILMPGEDVEDDILQENDAWLIDVPIEYYDDFELNLEDAMRDIAGIATQAISPYIQRMRAIRECVDENMEHPFSVSEWTTGRTGKFKWDKLCRKFERKVKGGYKEDGFAPIRNPKALRWCHVDTSVSGDSTGFAVGHVARWVEVERRDPDGNKFADLAPYIIIDFMLRINPPDGEQIFLPDVRGLLYQLMDHGFNFIGFSTDAYQSTEMLQQVKRKGIHTELISMDRTTAPYDTLKTALYEKRIKYYKYEQFMEELRDLEYDRMKGKIDHPLAGTKDLADAVAGCVYGLVKNASRLPVYFDAGTSNGEEDTSWVRDRKEPEVTEDQAGSYDEDFGMPFLIG